MDRHLISYFIGIFIVFSSHFYTLYVSDSKIHSVVNLIAGLAIAYYFMNKEKYIYF